jgi:anti-sigma factor RsiW
MNDQIPSRPIPPEWLAAYVDGELDAAARKQVEAWLADHPEALAEIQDQESLSPANVEYWSAVAPPLPSAQEWDDTLSRVAAATTGISPVVVKRVRSRRAAVAALVGLAAAVLAALVVFDRRPSRNQPVPATVAQESPAGPEQDQDDPVYQVASVDDVELIQLPEAAAALVVVGRHPMADVPLLLASAADVQVFNFGPDNAGNFPDIGTTLGPDASMLWAPSKP